MFYRPRTAGDPEYFKCACQKCGRHIEFPSHGAGVTIDCPHCGKKTVLGVGTADAPTGRKSKKALWVSLGLMAVISGVVAAFLWPSTTYTRNGTVVPAVPTPAVVPVKPAESADKPPAPSETVKDFEIGKITLQKAQDSGLVYAVGTAKNTVDRQRFGVKIELNLLNDQDQNIGVDSDYASVVDPHKAWQFKVLLTHSGVAKVTVADIKEQK